MENPTYARATEAYTRAEEAARRRRDDAIAKAEADYRQAVGSADLALQRARNRSEIPVLAPLRAMLEKHVAHVFGKEPGPFQLNTAIILDNAEPEYWVIQEKGTPVNHVNLRDALHNLADLVADETANPMLPIAGTGMALASDHAGHTEYRHYQADIYHELPDCQGQPFVIHAIRISGTVSAKRTYLRVAIYAFPREVPATLAEHAFVR
jgi:predicted  nucleic acid-binding Zn-ribbon protein